MPGDPPVVLVHGDDEVLMARGLDAAVDAAVGDRDRGEVLHELRDDDYVMADVVDAMNTPPFLADRRVVVARGVERFTADDLALLVAALADPLPTTRLVIERKGRVPKAVKEAVTGAGGTTVATGAPVQAKAKRGWLDERFDEAPVRLDRSARSLVVDHLGEDAGRLGPLLDTLVGVFGTGADLGVDDVRPYLGEQGGVPPWELTDPIDAGSVEEAVRALGRMIDGGGLHPLQVMAILHRHVEQALRLDGADAPDEKVAAQLLGMKGSTFPAKKALTRSRRLGGQVLRGQLGLLAVADRQLRGESALEGRAVLDVLVARLADPRRRR
ncbi:MAG: DNA polymerase III subunit delta [Actinomycetota bacterium]